VRQDAGLNLARHGSRGELDRAVLCADPTRIANQGRAIRATEAERAVSLDAIALGASFHIVLFGQVQSSQHILEPWVAS